jgi:hypothetical protein
MVNLNSLIFGDSSLQLTFAFAINNRGEIAGVGVPAGCKPQDVGLCGHAYVLIPNGDCDDECEGRIATSESNAAVADTVEPSSM